MSDITISMQLMVLPSNKIIVPGCEPSSELSSKTLAMYMSKGSCGTSLVDVHTALNAIPGSWLKFGIDFGGLGSRQRWFVFPSADQVCPCNTLTDWYGMLRGLAVPEEPVEESDACDVINTGFCPSPDFGSVPPPPDPYKPEGSAFLGIGYLPSVPPWVFK